MSVFLHGLLLQNYRGIGPQVQKIGPFQRCNFFIGMNNSGKSCVLNFIAAHLSQLHDLGSGGRLNLSALEVHLGATDSQVLIGLGIPVAQLMQQLEARLKLMAADPLGVAELNLKKLLPHLTREGFIWIHGTAANLGAIELSPLNNTDEVRQFLQIQEWRELWVGLTAQNGGGVDHWINEVMHYIRIACKSKYPRTLMVPAKRQIGVKGLEFDDYSGKGLIDKLAELQNPGATKRELTKEFQKINSFLQEVTGHLTARIEIPHDRHEVLVEMNGRVLPLSSLGTGVHEVVMIAAFCTLTSDSIVCIEEPEIHLHPLLQKKLISYLTGKTNNQYFIATHSSSIIDHPGAAVFHVSHENSLTDIKLATSANQKFRICRDLGYRASDLLQTNFIIWVEGPSDRIYINHWLQYVDRTLIEGIHYSLMFYGGRLLSHLTADDSEVTDFIALHNLNRNIAIIIDSDRRNKNTPINKTKQRIVDEFKRNADFVWITAGREIENYISDIILDSAIGSVNKSFKKTLSSDRYAHRLHFNTTSLSAGVVTSVDKLKVARAVAALQPELDVLDLASKIKDLVRRIRSATD